MIGDGLLPRAEAGLDRPQPQKVRLFRMRPRLGLPMSASSGGISFIFGLFLVMSFPAIAEEPQVSQARDDLVALGGALRAHVVPRRYTTLSAEMDGRIERMGIREGDSFEKSGPLVEFDCGKEMARLASAGAALRVAEKSARVNRRLDELGTTSVMNLTIAEAKVVEARAELETAEVKVTRCKVVAPCSGRVAELFVQRYQFVKRGEQLMRIVDPSWLEVEMIVPSRWLTWLRPGHGFELELDETGESHRAEVAEIGAWIDPVSQSVKIVARFAKPDARLLPGMSGRALFEPPKRP